MCEFTVCNVCENPGNFETAIEAQELYSNVREFMNEKFTVWRCSNCRSLHSREKVNLKQYYEHYPVKMHTLNCATRLAYKNRLRSLQKHGFKKRDTLLDYGCGTGVFVSFLCQGEYKASGYDPYVNEYSDKEVLHGEYDIVTSYDVLEHVEDPVELFEQLVRCVKKGGLLVIGTPDADKIDLYDTEQFSLELHQPYHRHILSEKALLNLGIRLGLEIVSISHRFYFDTLYPIINHRFLKTYVRCAGNFYDVLFERPRVHLLFTSPQLLFYCFFGYFSPPPGYIIVFFRKTG